MLAVLFRSRIFASQKPEASPLYCCVSEKGGVDGYHITTSLEQIQVNNWQNIVLLCE